MSDDEAYLKEHPEIQEEAKSLCGQELVVNKELYPEYMIFVYDAVIAVSKGIEAVLNINPNATFLFVLNADLMNSDEDNRKLLYEEMLKVEFEGQSGRVRFKPGVGDRLPVKLEVVNIHVLMCGCVNLIGWSNHRYW